METFKEYPLPLSGYMYVRCITNFPSDWLHFIVWKGQFAAQGTILAKIRFIALMTYVVKYFKWLFIQPN